jgi:hypothetical protein
MRRATPVGYYSSPQKDAVREHFDTPLVHAMQRRKGSRLRYFGLPGRDGRDIIAWQNSIEYVAAVERDIACLEELELLLNTQFPDIRYSTHWGDLDKVILTDRGKSRTIGGQPYRPRVSTWYRREIQGAAWEFDILNLDYFGPFLPLGTGQEAAVVGTRARERATALRRLFDSNRQDAWQPWVLYITVEAELVGEPDRDVLRAYLQAARGDASPEVTAALDFLLMGADNAVEEAARLVHGAAAILFSTAASDANLCVRPRGTVTYLGARDQPMIHLTYEFDLAEAPLAGPVSRLSLLRVPILQPRHPLAAPWFELSGQQVSGLTEPEVRACLDFLNLAAVDRIVGEWQAALAG